MSASEQIRAAFADVECPGDDALFEGDDEGAAEAFRGRHWKELAASDLDYHSCVLGCFTPEAFAYYLPAFMLAALEHDELGVADQVLHVLSPPKYDPRRPSFARRWQLLSPPQRLAVIAFLRGFEPRNPIHLGLVISSLENAG